MELTYTTATASDAERIQTLVETAFQAPDSRANWTADAVLNASFRLPIDSVRSSIVNPEAEWILVSNDQGTFVACCSVTKKSENRARFGMFAIDPPYQRAGLGRKVLAYAEDFAVKTWGVKTMDLDVLSTRQELMAWYQRCGYTKTGTSTPFPYEHVDAELPPGLTFIDLDKSLLNKAA